MNRRRFITEILKKGMAYGSIGGFLLACKSKPAQDVVVTDPCTDLSALSEDDIAIRESFKYVGSTPDPQKRCDNCGFWIKPAANMDCGGCEIMEGPINPNGYCEEWIEIES